MNILIADDERMVRVTLKSMLEDLNLNLQTIHEVDNGEALLKSLEHFSPDIAFVDIKMPKFSGLEAIKLAKSVSPDTQWVILTGFSEFEFAKQAIELGVSKYLLKPVSPQELQGTIDTLVKNNSANCYTLNKKFERDIIALYNRFDSAKELSLENITLRASFEAAVFYLDGDLSKYTAASAKKRFFSELSSIIDGLLSNEIRIALFNISDTQIATVCACNVSKTPANKDKIKAYFSKASELSGKYSNNELSITILRSSSFNSYRKLNESLLNIEKSSPIRVLLGIGSMYNLDKIESLYNSQSYIKLGSMIILLCKFFNEKKYLYFNNTLKQLEKTLSADSLKLDAIMKESMSKFLLCSINFSINTEGNTKTWIDSLYEYGESLLENIDVESGDYIDHIVQFISENYMHDIGINTIAEMLNITPNYLSSQFHKKTKMKFTDYLTEIRMLKAKELLAANKLSIAEIAESVGYLSTRHFTKLFLKYTNQYPSDYRKNLK